MRRLFACVCLCLCLMVAGCATTPTTTQQQVIQTVAVDAGYVAYRMVPEARPALNAVCLLIDVKDPIALQQQFKDLIGVVWKKANSTDAAMVVLTLNNLMGMVALKDESSKVAEGTRQALQGICQGVNLAAGSK